MNLLEHLAAAESWTRPGTGIVARLLQHLGFTLAAAGIATAIGVPLGLLLGHTRRGGPVLAGLGTVVRAVPILGLVVLMVLLVGSGRAGVLLPLVIVALPPLVLATAAGVRGADPAAVHSARALGLSPLQVVGTIEWPSALPQVLLGLRSAVLTVIATVTVAAYAGASGLGRFIVDGQRQGPGGGYPQMFTGVVVVAVLALLVHVLLGAAASAAARTGRRRAPLDDLVVFPAT